MYSAWGADGSGAIALLPLAGMITVSLLIVGVGVLMAVVLMVRRKEDPQSRGAGGDDKSKHLGKRGGEAPEGVEHCNCVVDPDAGMDMTVTAPLDMGTGQQRFVVSYSIKQGAEKQPDILGAQKSECE